MNNVTSMVSTPQPTLNTGFLTFTYREFEISSDYVDEKLMAKHGCDVFENFLSIFLRVNCPHSCPLVFEEWILLISFPLILLSVLAIELMLACQGIDLLRPLKTTEPLEAVHSFVRKAIKWVTSPDLPFSFISTMQQPRSLEPFRQRGGLREKKIVSCLPPICCGKAPTTRSVTPVAYRTTFYMRKFCCCILISVL